MHREVAIYREGGRVDGLNRTFGRPTRPAKCIAVYSAGRSAGRLSRPSIRLQIPPHRVAGISRTFRWPSRQAKCTEWHVGSRTAAAFGHCSPLRCPVPQATADPEKSAPVAEADAPAEEAPRKAEEQAETPAEDPGPAEGDAEEAAEVEEDGGAKPPDGAAAEPMEIDGSGPDKEGAEGVHRARRGIGCPGRPKGRGGMCSVCPIDAERLPGQDITPCQQPPPDTGHRRAEKAFREPLRGENGPRQT